MLIRNSLTFIKISLCYFGTSPVMVCTQHIWPHRTRTHKMQTHPTHKGLACLQFGSLIISWLSFDVTPPYSTESGTCNTSSQIIVSHHWDDVIVISFSSPLDIDLGDQFNQLPAEQALQLISHFDHKSAKHTRLMLSIHQRCNLHRKELKLHQNFQLTTQL